MSNVIDKRILGLKGFPKAYTQTNWETASIFRPAGFQQLAQSLYGGAFVAYLYNDSGVVIDRVLEDGKYKPSDMLAVYFPQYIQDTLDNDKAFSLPKANFLYIYGVGEESTNNNFADKILSALVKTNKLEEHCVIVSSDILMPGIFTKTYPLTNNLMDEKLQVCRV